MNGAKQRSHHLGHAESLIPNGHWRVGSFATHSTVSSSAATLPASLMKQRLAENVGVTESALIYTIWSIAAADLVSAGELRHSRQIALNFLLRFQHLVN